MGDDLSSFSFDGKRSLKWNQKEEKFGRNWKMNDIIGCEQKVYENHKKELLYYINGQFLGVAYLIADQVGLLSPALSLDSGEALVLNVGQKPFKFDQNCNAVELYPVYQLFIRNMTELSLPITDLKEIKETKINKKNEVSKDEEEGPFAPLNLEKDERFQGQDGLPQLQALGMNHLKAELSRRGLKSGGTLQERAVRLWSVKGISEDQIDGKLKAVAVVVAKNKDKKDV